MCLLNPGVFRFKGKTWLLVRVAEGAVPMAGKVRVPIGANGRVEILEFGQDDPALDLSDPRIVTHDRRVYLSTISHLRLLGSEDGIHFKDEGGCVLFGENALESCGIKNFRVSSFADGRFLLTYTAVSPVGYGVGLRVTQNWETFEHGDMILPPPNKDCVIFKEQVDGKYVCLHRSSALPIGGHDIWLTAYPNNGGARCDMKG